MYRDYDFNSRPHGGRPFQQCQNVSRKRISTHALTEGDEIICSFNFIILYFNSRPHGGRRYQNLGENTTLIFQLTPSRRATLVKIYFSWFCRFQLTPSRRATQLEGAQEPLLEISTHALTEGDGKFRQIFLLNRGYAYSISLYFLPHFISLLPQILSFQQKSFKFQVRIFLLFSVHLAFALQNQCVHHVKYRFCTNMFYFVFVLFTQIVKPQTIGLFIYDFF